MPSTSGDSASSYVAGGTPCRFRAGSSWAGYQSGPRADRPVIGDLRLIVMPPVAPGWRALAAATGRAAVRGGRWPAGEGAWRPGGCGCGAIQRDLVRRGRGLRRRSRVTIGARGFPVAWHLHGFGGHCPIRITFTHWLRCTSGAAGRRAG